MKALKSAALTAAAGACALFTTGTVQATEGGGSGEGHEQGGATHRERFPWHQGPVVGIPMNLNESAVSGLTAGEVACGSPWQAVRQGGAGDAWKHAAAVPASG